jgi:hypothetical protein
MKCSLAVVALVSEQTTDLPERSYSCGWRLQEESKSTHLV